MIVVILGPDGSGKSTIADIVVEALKTDGLHAVHYAHRFGVLPPLSSFRLHSNSPSSAVSDPMSSIDIEDNYDLKENSPLRALIYVTWYGIDYMIGGIWFKIRSRLSRDRHIAVFARYYYDYYYQSNNRRLPQRVKRIIELLVPRPDHIFFLDRDAEEIHKGKPELPVWEIKNQQRILCERLSVYPEFQVVDASNGAKKTADDILRLVMV